jgi:CHAD domain-containing protein
MKEGNAMSSKQHEAFRPAMRALIAPRWRAVWDAVPVAIEGVDPEGVHDARVASRRLRAAMDVAASAFPSEWYRPLHRVAKQITSELGEVRDRDVMLEYLEQELHDAPENERPGIERLISRLTSEREEARTKMLTFLADLEEQGVTEQAVKRFGSQAAPSQLRDSSAS